ncbi:MAG: hypothetical protein QME90_17260 [Thermodesulfobacteriota bacterium]|nr:hypothetical protein [Thermodesulfobacteriota bacterium]
MNKKELEELSLSNLDKVLRALERGDIEEAKECVKVMEKEAKHAHDTMVNFVLILLAYIGEKFGDEEVVKALRFRHDHLEQDQKRMLNMGPEDAVRHKAMIHRAHHSHISLTEEKERFVLKLDPCNSGGRLMREELKKLDGNVGRMKKSFPESWNRSRVSYYCVHCAQNSIISVERGAPHPTWIYERSDNPEGPCYQYYYKSTEDVPEKYFKELGLKKGK